MSELDALERRNNDPRSKTVISRHDLGALIERVRRAEDRLAILSDPGTVEAIMQGVWDVAEALGHPKASSSHAVGFLIDLIERLVRVRDAGIRYKESADAWASSESPLEINPLTGSIHFRRSPELAERDLRWREFCDALADLKEENHETVR